MKKVFFILLFVSGLWLFADDPIPDISTFTTISTSISSSGSSLGIYNISKYLTVSFSMSVSLSNRPDPGVSFDVKAVNINDSSKSFSLASCYVQANSKTGSSSNSNNIVFDALPLGNYNVIVNCSNTNYGVATLTGSVSYSFCPNTVVCTANTCALCQVTYCVTHDRHLSSVFECYRTNIHSHCSNSQALLDSWRQNAGTRTCPDCGDPYCPLCTHTCHDLPVICPNLPSCNVVTCPICNGSYCAIHQFHMCSDFSDFHSGAVEGVTSAIVTTQGQAIVNVDVEVNNDTDMSGVEAALQEVETAVTDVVEGVEETIAELENQTAIASETGEAVEEIKETLISTGEVYEKEYSQNFVPPPLDTPDEYDQDLSFFDQLKNKLLPPSGWSAGSESLVYDFTVSLLGQSWSFSIDLNDSMLITPKSVCRLISSVFFSYIFCFSVIRAFRQW